MSRLDALIKSPKAVLTVLRGSSKEHRPLRFSPTPKGRVVGLNEMVHWRDGVRTREKCYYGTALRGLSGKVTDRTFRQGNTDHAWTDVPPLATFTVRQRALRAVLP